MNPALPLGAGFRYSSYGPPYNPGTDYWISAGRQMAERFPGSRPSAIWIVGILDGQGTYLNFPCKATDPNIRCGVVDMNEQTLNLFDETGYVVWLQVEPGNAGIEELIEIVLNTYKHHPCIVGFGIDVEWYKSTKGPQGKPVTDEEADRWVANIQAIVPGYWLFLKHWDSKWMPPTVREGIFFVDDSQQFHSFDQMVNEFSEWGRYFSPSPVGFQFGYPSDKFWWQNFQDPPAEIGRVILDKVPNTQGLFWVDFSILDVFPAP